MSDQQLATQPRNALSVWSLETTQQKIQALVPTSLSWDRFKRLATSLIQRNPKIAECEPVSLMSVFSDCAVIGVYPDPVTGKAYVIPRFNKQKQQLEATLLVGYKGLRDIALRSPDIIDLWTGVVRKGDVFTMRRAPRMELVHEPLPEETGEIVGCYSIAQLRNGGCNYEWMPIGELNKIKGQALNGLADWKVESSPWTLHETEMNRKTVLRRHFKSLPLRAEDQEAAAKEVDVELTDGDVREAAPTPEQIEEKKKRTPAPKRSEKGAAAVVENTAASAETTKPAEVIDIKTQEPLKEETKVTVPEVMPAEPPKAAEPAPGQPTKAEPRTSLNDGETITAVCAVVECTPTAKGNMNAIVDGEYKGDVFHMAAAKNPIWKQGAMLRLTLNGKIARDKGDGSPRPIYAMVDKVEAMEEVPTKDTPEI